MLQPLNLGLREARKEAHMTQEQLAQKNRDS